MELKLKATPYKKFLKKFRSKDIENARDEAETVVEYGSKKYYFKAPNFRLIAYDIGNGRVDLTEYNHTALPTNKGIDGLKSDFTNGGGGGTKMTASLSTIVAATSEAARSKVVEAAIQTIIGGTAVNLKNYEVLFKAYNQPARFSGLLDQNGRYRTSWRPLKKGDYLHFFNSVEYTGDSETMRTSLSYL